MLLPLTIVALSYVLGAAILVRAWQCRLFSQFSFFFSYLIYLLVTGVVMNLIDFLDPQHFPLVFWLRFITLVVAEFALLLEIGDHIFAPYPAVRNFGRLVIGVITLGFSTAYIIPSFFVTRPSSVAVLDLVMRSAVTKCAILISLLMVARATGIRPGKKVGGVALGLALYLAINTANFALAASWGREVYGQTFTIIGPLSQTLCLLIWMTTLWRPEPALQATPLLSLDPREAAEPLPNRLGRMNNTLARLFRK